jgi:hypothetical protein
VTPPAGGAATIKKTDLENRYRQGTATDRLHGEIPHVTGIDGWPALAAWLKADKL